MKVLESMARLCMYTGGLPLPAGKYPPTALARAVMVPMVPPAVKLLWSIAEADGTRL